MIPRDPPELIFDRRFFRTINTEGANTKANDVYTFEVDEVFPTPPTLIGTDTRLTVE